MLDAVFLGELDLRHLTAYLPVLILLALFLKDFYNIASDLCLGFLASSHVGS